MNNQKLRIASFNVRSLTTKNPSNGTSESSNILDDTGSIVAHEQISNAELLMTESVGERSTDKEYRRSTKEENARCKQSDTHRQKTVLYV